MAELNIGCNVQFPGFFKGFWCIEQLKSSLNSKAYKETQKIISGPQPYISFVGEGISCQ